MGKAKQEIIIAYCRNMAEHPQRLERLVHLSAFHAAVFANEQLLEVPLVDLPPDVRWMNTQDYLASSRTPRIEQAGSTKDAQVVNIGFDGWVLPRAGVTFVWVLEEKFAFRKIS